MCLRWIVYLHLSLSQRSLRQIDADKHCRCFNEDTQGADGAADLLQTLNQSPLLEELVFCDCSQIPAAAWQKVRGAKWLNLKKANFSGCLAERNGWGVLLFSNVFYVYLFVSVGSCSNSEALSDLWSFRMSWSWPRRVKMDSIFSTDWFWQNIAGASFGERKVQMERQICFKHWISRRCWKS